MMSYTVALPFMVSMMVSVVKRSISATVVRYMCSLAFGLGMAAVSSLLAASDPKTSLEELILWPSDLHLSLGLISSLSSGTRGVMGCCSNFFATGVSEEPSSE
uniref:Putative secreted protein n=1 Tax=Ixodes ricinus TaxID=34613 RepID=A0A6B0UGT5_IXORI